MANQHSENIAAARLKLLDSDSLRNNEWACKAASLALRYLDTLQGRQFLMAEVREWAYRNGLDKPTDQRQWGIVTRALKRLGVITNIGIHYPSHAHGAHVSMWVLA